MTPAERLIAAADLLDQRASEATEGPWYTAVENDGVRSGRRTVVKMLGRRVVTVDQTRTHWDDEHGLAEANVRYIATMHPEVGKSVAAILREEANMVGLLERAGDMSAGWVNAWVLALADLVLAGGEQT